MEDAVSDHRGDDDERATAGRPLAEEGLDLGAWEPEAPPSDFAERVLARVSREASSAPVRAPDHERRWRGARWAAVAGGGAGALAIAATMLLRIATAPPSHGEAIARERQEVSIGSRGRAVLEPGAAVRWDGDEVVQSRGDVFYRVEPGARFRVHTPAGDVEVKGTCFAVRIRGVAKKDAEESMDKRDVRSGVVGAGLTALAFVAVYEGKVAVSHASGRADVAAGEAAELGAGGVAKAELGAGEKAFGEKALAAESSEAEGDSRDRANQNLVAQIGEYRQRLESLAQQKSALEKKLETTEQKLASQSDGAAPSGRSEWDLTQDDWVELAKKGAVKYRLPCPMKAGWTFTPEKLAKMGLAPHDAPVMTQAYERSYKRVWDQLRPLCLQAVGNADVVDKLGAASCPTIIHDVQNALDPEAAKAGQKAAAEIRAGLKPEPGPNENVHPVTRVFLILTAANKAFENDLAASFGPEEAHRLAFSSEGCTSTSHWGGGP